MAPTDNSCGSCCVIQQDDNVTKKLHDSYFDKISNSHTTPITWRADPESSFSDWIIEVACEESKELVAIYHVHKVFLGAGVNRSDYFEAVFKSKYQVKELIESRSKITLLPSAADTFPDFLDHIYTGKCDIRPDNALSLKFLAKYFGVSSLFKILQEFINNDMNSNFLTYFSNAYMYNDEAVLQSSEEQSARNFKHIHLDQLCALDPMLFQIITSSDHLKCTSIELSKRVVEYCRRNPSHINEEFLLSVADSNVMPTIEPSVALYLLSLCYQSKCADEFTERMKNHCVTACTDWESLFREISTNTTTCPTPITPESSKDKTTLHDIDDYTSAIPDEVMIKLLKLGIRNAILENGKLKRVVNSFHVMTKWGKSQIETRASSGGAFPNTADDTIKGIRYKHLDRSSLEFQRFNQKYPLFYYKEG